MREKMRAKCEVGREMKTYSLLYQGTGRPVETGQVKSIER